MGKIPKDIIKGKSILNSDKIININSTESFPKWQLKQSFHSRHSNDSLTNRILEFTSQFAAYSLRELQNSLHVADTKRSVAYMKLRVVYMKLSLVSVKLSVVYMELSRVYTQ